MAKSLQVSDVGSVVRLYREEIDAAIRRVVDSGWFILGPEVEALESAFARMTGTRHGIAVASGTDAVELALRAAGVVPGDAVITVSHTASASAAAIERSGATPWFVDIDRDRFTMDPGALDTVLTQSTKAAEKLKVGAVLPVHLYGIPADMAPIRQIAQSHGIPVVEDAAQAHGAVHDGRPVGSLGSAGAFSFYPTKNLGALGDGGMVVTNDEHISDAVRSFRQYGWRTRFVSEREGTNSRLDEIQAAILLALLPHLEELNDHRRRVAAAYDDALAGAPVVTPPGGAAIPGIVPVYHQYVVRVPTGYRDRVQQTLAAEDIATAIHYPVPVHMQPAYSQAPRGDLTETEAVCSQILSLPIGAHVSEDDARRVAAALIRAVSGATPPA